MIIAIDGPAGAGKSTVCRILAGKLGYTYLDTGAMYRAVAWAFQKREGPGGDCSITPEILGGLGLRFTIQERALSVFYKGKKLGDELRDPEITRQASAMSQNEAVRNFLTSWQRKLGAEGGVVAEGRDMTTVVFPEAPVKVYLTADLRTRTERRLEEYAQKGVHLEYSALESQIRDRDEADSKRALAPLRPAPEAYVLDTSGKGVDEVISNLMEHISEKSADHGP